MNVPPLMCYEVPAMYLVLYVSLSLSPAKMESDHNMSYMYLVGSRPFQKK